MENRRHLRQTKTEITDLINGLLGGEGDLNLDGVINLLLPLLGDGSDLSALISTALPVIIQILNFVLQFITTSTS